jgi:ornithine cyclodeaminase/alanine dehydrogenase-like protein (mu-crystallin family)
MTDLTALPRLDAAAVDRLVSSWDAVEGLEAALHDGLDPEADPARVVMPAPSGQVLLMPAFVPRGTGRPSYAGVKVATVAPANPDLGLPRIQGVYLLLDGETLAPVALLDGIALTSLRTPAVSALATRHLAVADARRLVVFGTGPQAWGHVRALAAVRPVEHVGVVARDPTRTARFVHRCRDAGLAADVAELGAVADADLVACCTTAREPIFDGARLADHATVVAVGSHQPEAREVDDVLVGRATVVVESRASALREAGDVVQAVRAGVLTPDDLNTLSDVVTGAATVDHGRPRLFKSTGMAWEDLVVATQVHERSTR